MNTPTLSLLTGLQLPYCDNSFSNNLRSLFFMKPNIRFDALVNLIQEALDVANEFNPEDEQGTQITANTKTAARLVSNYCKTVGVRIPPEILQQFK